MGHCPRPQPFRFSDISDWPQWEVWRPVEETGGVYEVSNLGRVRRASTGRMLKVYLNPPNLYSRVTLCLGSGRRRIHRYVHRLVAVAFIPGRSLTKTQVDHRNNDKNDNRACNLQWVTLKMNTYDRWLRHRQAKDRAWEERMREKGHTPLTQAQIEEHFPAEPVQYPEAPF